MVSLDSNYLDLPPVDNNRQVFHGFFRFPGSFHPPLIQYLIQKNENRDNIGDPMCGSGAVALGSVATGKNVTSMDIDPLSCLITKIKSKPVETDIISNIINDWLSLIGDAPQPQNSSQKEALEYKLSLENNTKYRFPKNVFHWFDPYVIIDISKSLLSIRDMKLENVFFTEILEAIVASIIRRVSRADPQPVSGLEVTKIMRARLKNGLVFDVKKEINKRCKILLDGYEHLNCIDNIGESIVYNGDILNDWTNLCQKYDKKFDLIITSPPYCNAIEYWRRHRLEYFWLGMMDNNEIRSKSRQFIGTTTSFLSDLREMDALYDVNSKLAKNTILKIKSKGKIKKSLIIKRYFIFAEKWIEEIMKTLGENGVCYLIVGPSTSYGVHIKTPDIISEISNAFGYKNEISMNYNIKNQRMQYTTKNNIRIKTESVIKITK